MSKALRYTWVLIAVAAVFLGWTYHSRKTANREFVQRLEERKASPAQKTIEAYGGDQLTIMAFYGMPGVIRRGESAELCYGVNNAKEVRIEPPVESVWPSLSRCVKVSPARDTEYTLIAVNEKGLRKTANLKIKVQ